MITIMSACGALCSDCPAYLADAKGIAPQQRTAAAWKKIYRLSESAQKIACGGCMAPDAEVFHTCRRCKARLCCHSKGFTTCAECAVEPCPHLEHAQSIWDGVPDLACTLSREDSVTYAQPYCNHRSRLAEARVAGTRRVRKKSILRG
jgi:hypothetical protein